MYRGLDLCTQFVVLTALRHYGNRDMVLSIVEVELLTVYTRTQVRATGTLPEVVDDYVAAMENGAEFPPVDVYYDGVTYWLADGFHRVAAYRRRNVASVQANVYNGDERDALLHAMQANLRHGLRVTRADKRHAVEIMLRDAEWCKLSDRQIGTRCGVDGKTVAAVRRDLGLDDQTKRVTVRAGRVVELETGNIGAKRSKVASAETPQSTVQPEPTAKDRDAAAKVAEAYGFGLDEALVYVLCQRSKREQDAQRRAERKAEQDRLRLQVARKLRRSLPEQQRKRIRAGFDAAAELAKQYGVPTSVVLDVIRQDAKKER